MDDEIKRVGLDQGQSLSPEELAEAERCGGEIEEEFDAELEEKIRRARERKKQRPKIWRPQPGEEKAVKVESIQEKEVEGFDKPMRTFLLRDLRNGQRYSLVVCGVLEKNLEIKKSYLLEYQGKILVSIDGENRLVHSWDWELIR